MTQYTFTPTQDGYIKGNPEAAKTTNFGSEIFLQTGEEVDDLLVKIGLYRSHLEFDVSSLTGLTLVSAVLRVYLRVPTPAGGDLNATCQRNKRAWVEAQQTWNIYSTGNNWQTAGAGGANDVGTPSDTFTSPPSTASVGWYTLDGLDLLATVNDAITNWSNIVKIQLKMDQENDGWPGNMWSFESNEGDHPPELIVNDDVVTENRRRLLAQTI